MRNYIVILGIWIVLTFKVKAQETYVDKNGVWRWHGSVKEVCAFGVNYTIPFAHAYRMAKRLNIDIEKAIDLDVYHFARLGFDAFRVHVWDTEISDTLGNLIDNEHLRLFDYLIYRMKERGMKFIITPIAYWGNGWPEPDGKTPGFSHKYGKSACLENPEAILAQQRYLLQFVSHVNRYTKLAYKDDPDVLAFEISNEPHHKGSSKRVTEFINGMVKAIRKSGCRKPVFYNVTHSIHLAQAYFQTSIQGGTYQWYPTGLGSRHSLQGNLLPHVDHYPIPFKNVRGFLNKTKIVYEFDAADCAGSYIYPAMARGFRTVGMQVATHFSYDPSFMAHLNTEYGTHYMNLLYTPHKAIGLMIAAEAFRSVPLYKSYGQYPNNVSFENFHLDHENDLALMNSPEKFLYSRSTVQKPVDIARLRHIAGTGNSPVIQYEGTGAYFLDKISDGLWRLEVLPDAAWLTDPFSQTSPDKIVACVINNLRQISIKLPDIPGDFYLLALNRNEMPVRADNFTLNIYPGTYLISGSNITVIADTIKLGKIRLRDYAADEQLLYNTAPDFQKVIHQPPRELSAGKDYNLTAEIITPHVPEEIVLYYYARGRLKNLSMKHKTGFTYECTIPGADISHGVMEYFISLKNNGTISTFPDGTKTNPTNWDFYFDASYRVRVVPSDFPIQLFKPDEDYTKTLRIWAPSSLTPLPAGNTALKIMLDNPEQHCYFDSVSGHYLYPVRFYFGDVIRFRKNDLPEKKHLFIRCKTNLSSMIEFRVGLVDDHCNVFDNVIHPDQEWRDFTISVESLRPNKLALLPRGYPNFLPFWFESNARTNLNITRIENLQLLLIIPSSLKNHRLELEIESVQLK